MQAGLLALISIVVGVGLLEARPIDLRDASQVFTYAYNLAHYGVFSLDRSDTPDVPPEAMRGPAYPSLVALSMMASSEAREADLACFLERPDGCAGAQVDAKRVNLLIIAGLSAASFLVACDICGSTLMGWIVGLLVMSGARFGVGSFSPDSLAALALLLHAWALYRLASGRGVARAWQTPMLGGVAIGVLSLTRSMYFY